MNKLKELKKRFEYIDWYGEDEIFFYIDKNGDKLAEFIDEKIGELPPKDRRKIKGILILVKNNIYKEFYSGMRCRINFESQYIEWFD